ncbi:BZ3500_MvSof-1268-A1-R1_Chr3-1g05505 [Microbotryum saponariae]|uniref:Protoporphyrinogen oxidase n=1 Tax=Microbotryum saponariae TaxID=289078 RepID=A0A2X0NGP4_9BASI|nr:BZ3500_MvSof-1268-A1-R1_Chr3-1g05505 [Microbotryum saponariae]SDA04696.1 BZ3501_MvSof-1269-A2-R1_Chr3-1g05176 [Microbotryum saponariae]
MSRRVMTRLRPWPRPATSLIALASTRSLSSQSTGAAPLCPPRRATTPLRRTPQPITRSKCLSSSIRTQHPDAPPPQRTVAILGGGLSGLSSAFYFLRALPPHLRQSTRIVVCEKQDRVGGWCRAIKVPLNGGKQGDQLVFETGPRSIRPVGLMGWLTIEMVSLQTAHTIGLTPRIVTVSKSAPSAKNRYLFIDRSLFLLPSSLWSAFKSLFSLQTNLMRRVIPSILLEPFRPRSPLHATPDGGDETVDAFFSRRFGPVLASNMISAMIHGIYAGDTRRLSVRAIFPGLWEAEREWGSVILAALFGGIWRKRGWKPKSAYRLGVEREAVVMEEIKERLVQSGEEGKDLVDRMLGASVWGIKGGLEELTFGLERWLREQGVEFRLGEESQVERTKEGEWTIKTPTTTLHPTHLITTLPSLLPDPISPPPIPATTVSVINLAFPTSPTTPRLLPPGFGYLIPRTVPRSENPHQALGIIFDSDVMPHVDACSTSSTTSEGLEKLSLLIGGSYWLDHHPPPEPSHSDLVKQALQTLQLHFPSTSFPTPSYAFSTTHQHCIPQIPPYHFLAFRQMGQRLRQERRVRVAVVGGGFASVGVNGAVKAAWEVGEGMAKDVRGEGGYRTGTEMWDL